MTTYYFLSVLLQNQMKVTNSKRMTQVEVAPLMQKNLTLFWVKLQKCMFPRKKFARLYYLYQKAYKWFMPSRQLVIFRLLVFIQHVWHLMLLLLLVQVISKRLKSVSMKVYVMFSSPAKEIKFHECRLENSRDWILHICRYTFP